jgi:hypothetical protein
MPEGSYLYCDVSLPVPLDQPFTYSLPETLRHRVREGSRLVVPFGRRKLTGVILRCHDERPAMAARDALRLIDAEPVLDAQLLALGRWIAGYYCAPLGEVLRGMLPLAAEIRRGKVWTLTDAGRDAARQLLLDTGPDDPVAAVLRMLEKRPLSAAWLAKALPLADKAVRSLERKGFIAAEQVESDRDPLRAPAARLRIELAAEPTPNQTGKLSKPERELKAFLELHVGSHNLKDLEGTVRGASVAARSLARKGLVALKTERLAIRAAAERPPHTLNPAQQAAADAIERAIHAKQFHTFLLYGVTGSGKTEVYLHAIEAALLGRPQRAAAGSRNRPHAGRGGAVLPPLRRPCGDSAFGLHRRRAERAVAAHPLGRGAGGRGHPFRRIRAGAGPGPDRDRRRARRQLQAGRNAPLQRPGYGHRARAGGRRHGGAGLGHPQSRKPLQRRTRQVYAARASPAHRSTAHAHGRANRHARGISGDPQAGHVFAPAAGS